MGATLRLGIFTLLGQAQYLNGDYAQARQSLQKALSMHPGDHVAILYLGLTQARLGDRQAGLKNIQAGMSGIANFLNYITRLFDTLLEFTGIRAEIFAPLLKPISR